MFSRNQIGLYQLLCFEMSLEQSFCRLAHTAGGVLLTWDKRVYEKIDCVVGRFSVASGKQVCLDLYRVYGSTIDGLRDAL